MSRAALLEDRLRRAEGRAATAIGLWCEAYRPQGGGPALDPANRFLRLPAFLAPPEGRPPGYGAAAWRGVFDAAYTRPGDYIMRPESAPGADDAAQWFIAAQEPLTPILCIRAERMLRLTRPLGASEPGINGYGGAGAEAEAMLLDLWPASVLTSGGTGTAGADLPADVPAGSWQILLPATPGITLRTDDIARDDLGRAAVVTSAELTALGWRLIAREASA